MVGRASGHLANLDLNLLVALRELLRERNVTRAAKRIGITQPAASAALSRLRRHFGDDLLVRGKGGYSLTPLAVQLAEQVEAVCAAAERLFGTGAEFRPESTDREFTLLMADYTVAVLGGPLSRLLAARAPGAGLHVRLVRESLATYAAETIRLIDGVVAPPAGPLQSPEIGSAELFRDRWSLLAANGRLPDSPTPADLANADWVVPYHPVPGHPSAAPIPRQLALLGIRPRVAVRVESYRAVPHFVAGTERLALLQHRLAVRAADDDPGLRVLEPPEPLDPVVERLWWHRDRDDDPAHAWLRTVLAEAAQTLDEQGQ